MNRFSLDIAKIKIIISLVLAFIFSYISYSYIDLVPTPHINIQKVQTQLTGLNETKTSLMSHIKESLESVSFSTLTIARKNPTPTVSSQFSDTQPVEFDTKPSPAVTIIEIEGEEEVTPVFDPQTEPAKSTPIINRTTTIQPNSAKQSTIQPTQKVKPTTKPRPTKVPKPTAITLQNTRPGKNKEEVFGIIAKEMCVPEAMLRATYQIETGWSPYWVGFYTEPWNEKNTYHGTDSAEGQPDTKIMGPMQMMAQTWRSVKPVVSNKYNNTPLSMDVFFDAVLVSAYHLRNVSLAMSEHAPCDDWSLKYIAKGACKYGASCGGTDDYCRKICNFYNTYTKGPKKNCASIPNIISMDGVCQLK